MLLSSSCIALLIALALSTGAPVALDNGMIRIELEPRTFSVRFVGVPGGRNFIEPAYLTPTQLAGGGWLEPCGITTDLLPVDAKDAPLRRGPAEIVELRDDYILLLGPEHPELRWRLKKEFQLARDTAALTYKVTILSALKEERGVRIRTTAHVPWPGEMIVPRAPGRLTLLRGAYPGIAELLEGDREHYAVPLASRANRDRALLASPASEMAITTDFGRWTRRMEIRSSLDDPAGGGRHRTLALLDDSSHTYQAALEGGQSGVNVGAPMVVIEHWSIGPAEGATPVSVPVDGEPAP